jgi:hypothetical protein
MGVLHHCDNPPCVRPDHLFLGDAIANNADKVRKGRQSRGDQHDSRTRPECLARGDRNGRRLHPERYAHVKSSGVRGEAHGMARLTTEQVRAIRAKYQPRRVTIAQLAQEFGVSTHTIQAILSRRLWAHVA